MPREYDSFTWEERRRLREIQRKHGVRVREDVESRIRKGENLLTQDGKSILIRGRRKRPHIWTHF